MARLELMERELAIIQARLDEIENDRKIYGRLGFSQEQIRLEVKRLERRRVALSKLLSELNPSSEASPRWVPESRVAER